MLEILTRSIARAGGIEVPENVSITGSTADRRSVLAKVKEALERWNIRRSTYLTLKHLDDRTLADIGLHRSMLHGIADDVSRLAAANDNARPVALSQLFANDNDPRGCAGCV